jgi:DNA replication regulator DPB11
MQMGAIHKLDLTSDVTHLIVGDIQSKKYEYVARAREDVKVVTPEWLEAVRLSWMQGDDVDVAALEAEYQAPPLYQLRICLTGFNDPDERRQIQETVTHNGAEYHGDLTKSVTHLIAATPSGKKYEHAVTWGLNIVSYEWLRDSLDRGMALLAEKYHPTLPVEERGKGAWERRQQTSPVLGKRSRATQEDQAVADSNFGKRKLRRSASSKMGSQSQSLWAGITSGGLEKKKVDADEWTEADASKPEYPTSDMTKQNTRNGPFFDDTDSEEDLAPCKPVRSMTKPDGIFEGRIIFVHGFDEQKTKILAEHLASNAATVVEDASELDSFDSEEMQRGFVVLPHDAPPDFASLPEAAGKLTAATNWWVERCLHRKRLVDPADDIMCRPFEHTSISGFNGLVINSTSFGGIELLHVTKVVSLMGATYDEWLSPKVSVLVCNSRTPSQEKLKYVTEKRIPAVHSTWLWDCINAGKIQPFDKYLLNDVQPRTNSSNGTMYAEVPTAPISDKDRKMRAQISRSGLRLGTSRSHTLDLSLSANPTPSATVEEDSVEAPFHLDDEEPQDLCFAMDGSASTPLQDINPAVNSPRRPSTTSHPSTKSKSRSASRENSAVPTKPLPAQRLPDNVKLQDVLADKTIAEVPKPDHTAIMMEILARRKAVAATSGNAVTTDDKRKRRKAQLGRATSGTGTGSNQSTAEISSGPQKADPAVPEPEDEDLDHDLNTVGEVRGVVANRRTKFDEYQPSQSLLYEGPEVQAAREQMIRAMGGTVQGAGAVVGPIGVVKDVVLDGVGGVAGRGSRKKRR